MTIIVGLICKDGIVLASDSQTTTGTTKRCDAKKFAIVEFTNAKVLVAQAGGVCTSSRAIEILRDLARGKELVDYRMAASMAEKAMRQVKDELRVQNCDCSMDVLRELISRRNDIDCELMIAHYHESKPCIFTVGLELGIARKGASHYVAIGCGGSLGEYLLSEHSKPAMESKLGSAVAVFTVETVKKHDPFCGGPTRVGIVWLDQEEGISGFGEDDVTGFAKEIDEINESTKEDRNKQISERLQSLADRQFARIFNEI